MNFRAWRPAAAPPLGPGLRGARATDSTNPPPATVRPAASEAAWRVLLRFGRPHTLLGTSLSVFAIALLALPGAPEALADPAGLFFLVAAIGLAALAANLYIVGLNQIADVALDRINKPDLPIAAGTLDPRRARQVVLSAGALALGLGWWIGGWLLATLALSMAIGTAYSLPPLHFKRSAIGAPLCIALVRGPLVNIGLYAQFRASMGADLAPSVEIGLLALFMTLFGLGIGVLKDLPDLAGDRAHAVGNLVVRYGPGPAFGTGCTLLVAAYGFTAALGLAYLPAGPALALAAAHGVALGLLLHAARDVSVEDRDGVKRFYGLVWRLFYAEYLLMPLVALAVFLPA